MFKRSLVQIYRESDLYTIYYDVVENKFYKVPFRRTSRLSDTYLGVIGFIVLASVMRNFYGPIQHPLLDLLLVVLVIFFAKMAVDKVFQALYMFERIRQIEIDDLRLERYMEKGMKQSNIESPTLIFFLILSVLSMIGFLTLGNVELLLVGGGSVACVILAVYMKPIKRRNVIKQLQRKGQ